MAEMLVLDTNVLVDRQRGLGSAAAYLSGLLVHSDVVIHPVTIAELVSGAKDQRTLTSAKVLAASFLRNADFIMAIELLEIHTLTVGVEWPDCLIAATCLRLDLPLVTLNEKHFRPIRGLKVRRPY